MEDSGALNNSSDDSFFELSEENIPENVFEGSSMISMNDLDEDLDGISLICSIALELWGKI